MKDTKTFYMCGVDWQHEFGEVFDVQHIFHTIEELKENNGCWESCGIVEVEMKAKWVHPQDLKIGLV